MLDRAVDIQALNQVFDDFIDQRTADITRGVTALKAAPAPNADTVKIQWETGLRAIASEMRLELLAALQTSIAETDRPAALARVVGCRMEGKSSATSNAPSGNIHRPRIGRKLNRLPRIKPAPREFAASGIPAAVARQPRRGPASAGARPASPFAREIGRITVIAAAMGARGLHHRSLTWAIKAG